MKKKIWIIAGILVVVIVAVLLIFLLSKPKYTVTVSVIDERSPDRLLTVYKNKTEKVEVLKISAMDGTVLCKGNNTTVYYGDVEKEEKLKVTLKDKSEVIAKVIKEEVK